MSMLKEVRKWLDNLPSMQYRLILAFVFVSIIGIGFFLELSGVSVLPKTVVAVLMGLGLAIISEPMGAALILGYVVTMFTGNFPVMVGVLFGGIVALIVISFVFEDKLRFLDRDNPQ